MPRTARSATYLPGCGPRSGCLVDVVVVALKPTPYSTFSCLVALWCSIDRVFIPLFSSSMSGGSVSESPDRARVPLLGGWFFRLDVGSRNNVLRYCVLYCTCVCTYGSR